MVITKLMGGLGNQMFQYAIGRCLSIQNKVPLKLDVSFFKKDNEVGITNRKFELDAFNIKASKVNRFDNLLFAHQPNKKRHYTQQLLRKIYRPALYNEKQIGKFQNEILECSSKRIILNGYWQTQKYFFSVAEVIRSEFIPINPISENTNNYLQTINSGTISLHIRRTDYLKPILQKIHGLCSVQYYENALNIVRGKTKIDKEMIFSDDLIWCKKHLKFLENPIFVSGCSSVDDMFLMSRCKHNIIANSSFSWWGAWLNKNYEKIVIAPLQWFVKKEIQKQAIDMIPASWYRI